MWIEISKVFAMYGSGSTKYSLAKNQSGFIVIIGLGLFAIMAIFMIILQKQNLRMLNNIQMWDNQTSAQFLGTSALEWLQFKVNKIEDGEPFNYASGKCKFTRGTSGGGGTRGGTGGGSASALIGDSSNPSFCQEIYDELLHLDTKSQTVEIELKVKGNMRSTDVLDSDECYVDVNGTIATNCYINPLPKTGSAGTNCKAYNPSTSPNIDPIDHPCNWNKLELGSNMIDRVAIPLYYKNPGDNFVEPFYGQPRAQLAIKIRTPCETNADSFGYCADSDRYVLDETEDDIVAQWQLSGMCGEKECTFVPTDVPPTSAYLSSMIRDSYINDANDKGFILLDSSSLFFEGFSTTTKESQLIKDILTSSLQKPILTLFLMDKLQSLNGRNVESVPYLEYQIVTGVPTATSKMSITAEVSVNGNAFKRTLTRNYMKGIIDFAVQN